MCHPPKKVLPQTRRNDKNSGLGNYRVVGELLTLICDNSNLRAGLWFHIQKVLGEREREGERNQLTHLAIAIFRQASQANF